jgi:hypothetical protein
MSRTALLAVCLAAACSGDDDVDANRTAVPTGNNSPKANPAKGEIAGPPPPVAPARRGFNPPRLYVNDRGVHFEIYNLDDLPYDGKIVTYHDADQKIVKTEQVYEKGRLSTECEYWPNSNPKIEITHKLDSITTNRFDQQGQAITPPPPAAPPPTTRALNWTYNYNAGNSRLEAFIGQDTSVLTKYLGTPDDKLGNGWIYRNMLITDFRTKRRHSGVQFSINGNTVSSFILLK